MGRNRGVDPRVAATMRAHQFEQQQRHRQALEQQAVIQQIIGQALEKKAVFEELLKNARELIEHLPEPDLTAMQELIADAEDALNQHRSSIVELFSQVLGLRQPPQIEVPTTEQCQEAEASKGRLEVVQS